ncbi:MAG: hypothetical protein M0R31_10625 [Candidatus Riflebacteria bacterium]|nr:hypothetical protein [Candidatus Riflebacteria bacterium]
MFKQNKILCMSAVLLLLSGVASEAQNLPQNTGRKIFPSPSDKEDEKGAALPVVDGVPISSPAFPFVAAGREKMAEKRYAEAIEAFRTALRLEPLNPNIWGLYDNAVIEDYNAKESNSMVNGIARGALRPNFAITRTDSYIDINTLCIVGHLKNLSGTKKHKIVLTARLFDKNNREVAKAEGTLRNYDKGLLANESCLFEILVKEYPKNVTDFKVEVSSWE